LKKIKNNLIYAKVADQFTSTTCQKIYLKNKNK
jgi:hypothetical protein